jgi:hypothetical protein
MGFGEAPFEGKASDFLSTKPSKFCEYIIEFNSYLRAGYLMIELIKNGTNLMEPVRPGLKLRLKL